MRKFLMVTGLYLAAAVLITWPLGISLGTQFIGHPFGDVYEYMRHSWWIRHALQTGQPLFDQPLLAYPDGLSALWLWANPLQSFPAWLLAFVLPLPAAYNLSVLLWLALNGWAMFVLADDLTGGRSGAAWLAGLIFMLFPAFQGQLAIGHSGLLVLWPVPLFIYAMRRLQTPQSVTRARWRWLALAALLFTVSLWGNLLLLIYLVGPVTALLLLKSVAARDWQGLRWRVLAVVLGGLVALVFIVPFLAEELAKPPRLSEGGDVAYSADLLTLVTPSFYHPLFRHLPYTSQVLGIDPFERMGYIGMVAGVLAMIGVWRRRAARWWLALAALAWVLSLGPLLKVLDTVISIDLGEQVSYITLPWLLFQDIPLINTVRTPARFNFTVALALAVLAAYGAAWLGDRLPRGRGLVFVALAGWVVFEYQSFWPFPTIPGTVPGPVQAMAARDDIRAVYNLPWSHLLAQKDGMFLQTGHHQPLLAGHVTRRTPVDPAKLTILQETLDPALLDDAGVDVMIVHKTWAEEATFAVPGEVLYEDGRIAVYEVPPPEAAPQFTTLLPDRTTIRTRADAYLFAPEPGWTVLRGRLQAGGRDVALLLDGQRVHGWQEMDDITLEVPVPAAGYHTVTLALEPPCPQHFADALRCRAVQIDDLAFADFVPGTGADVPVMFARGVELAAFSVDAGAQAVRLMWRFDELVTENDVRFVHVVDAQGQLVAQDDRTLGARSAGEGWAEQMTFADLPPGAYEVYAGWYTYPDFARFAVLADVPGAADGWVHLGALVIEDQE